uniref:Bromo domain-containing protein n=2 Tax=Cuerna arida TaxID=1464854 RepID=A0A1B6GUL2_9HEMI
MALVSEDDFGPKKHKKHKREKNEDKPGLRLILKVGSSSTPEHSNDSHGPGFGGDEESMQSVGSLQPGRSEDRLHKKAKKKKKKKEKDKDKDRDKHDKKKKHHHKEKRKRLRDESSQDDVSVGEESLQEPPPSKRAAVDKTPDVGDTPMLGSPGSNREPRLCVQLLRQRQEMLSAKSPLQKLLDNLQQSLEKKDPQQFFAWPVTDQIAPGYSQIIHQPMDFSTMHQKIEDNSYSTLKDYVDDFKQMCGNAMIYNHPETIYYKAAKRLLHAGLKLVCEEKLRALAVTSPWILQIPAHQLGVELGTGGVRGDSEKEEEEETPAPTQPARRGPNFLPESKFEAIPDDLTAEEVLEQTRKAAQKVRQRLDLKKVNTKMGFLRTQKDGTTSLAILVPGEGLDPESNERPVCLGQLIGKIPHGSGALQGFREDRRNITKTVKPLYYGAFGSYAPSYDSTFANLSKEESDLVYQTYGDESAAQYAESILNFAKDCDYTLTMVDNLLDLLTGGDHRKTKRVLEERRKFREEEERVRQLMTPAPPSTTQSTPASALNDVRVDVTQLKTLADLGIETSFLDYFEKGSKEETAMQERLDQTTALLEKLQQVQNDRLSAPPPQHLGNIMQPSDTELNLAEKITESLTQLAKQVPPGAVVSIPAIRKAMGIAPDTASVGTATDPPPAPPQSTTRSPDPPSPSLPATVDKSTSEESSGGEEEGVGVDLESELREFLESDTALTNFPLHDDKTIEEMLSES